MNVGVVFPQVEIGQDPAAIRDYAQAVEALGYTHILVFDHVLGANPERPGGWKGPYTFTHAFHEPFVLFSFLAGVTSRLGFFSGVFVLPQRQTALFAKQAANLDIFCRGRLRLGVGIGWNNVEYEALDVPFEKRGARLDDQMRVLRRLCTERSVTEASDFHRITDAGLLPLPVQRPIPLWIGGMSPAAARRAARLGDGWIAAGNERSQLKPPPPSDVESQ